MRRILLFLCLLAAQTATGQTMDDLFARYKAMGQAVYMTIPPDSLMNAGPFQGSKVSFAESLSLRMDDCPELSGDLEGMKGYERIDMLEYADIETRDQKEFLEMWIDAGLAMYGRKRGRKWVEVMSVIPMPNESFSLIHIKGRLLDRALQVSVSASRSTGPAVGQDGCGGQAHYPQGALFPVHAVERCRQRGGNLPGEIWRLRCYPDVRP